MRLALIGGGIARVGPALWAEFCPLDHLDEDSLAFQDTYTPW
jgi:hypothetical protein